MKRAEGGVVLCYNITCMKKVAFIASLFGASVAFAADSVVAKAAEVGEGLGTEAEVARGGTEWFSAGFDADLFSAYVFRNAVFNDELVLQPAVWVDLTLFDILTVGGNVWQNWNLTDRLKSNGVPKAMNETDYNVHVGANIWESEDEKYSFYFMLQHDWYTYRYDFPNVNELALRLEFNNPLVGVYGQYTQAYHPVCACHFEVGLKQDWSVGELLESESDFLNRLSAGFDWSVNFASGRFFTNYIYGPVPGVYNPELDEYDDEAMSNGIGGTTIKGSLAYQVCDHFTVGAVLAFTSAMSGEARDAIAYMERGGSYKDCVWGGIQVKIAF